MILHLNNQMLWGFFKAEMPHAFPWRLNRGKKSRGVNEGGGPGKEDRDNLKSGQGLKGQL